MLTHFSWTTEQLKSRNNYTTDTTSTNTNNSHDILLIQFLHRHPIHCPSILSSSSALLFSLCVSNFHWTSFATAIYLFLFYAHTYVRVHTHIYFIDPVLLLSSSGSKFLPLYLCRNYFFLSLLFRSQLLLKFNTLTTHIQFLFSLDWRKGFYHRLSPLNYSEVAISACTQSLSWCTMMNGCL